MKKEETVFYDNKGRIICFYDVVFNIKTNKQYIVLPITKNLESPVLAKLSPKTGKPSSRVRYPLDSVSSKNYEVIGNRGFILD